MAAIAQSPRHAVSNATFGVLFLVPGYAQGDEGRFLCDDVTRAAQWLGPSEYLRTLLVRRSPFFQSKQLLITVVVLTTCCCGLILGGVILDLGEILFPLAAATGVAAYAFLSRWVARQECQSGFLRIAERIRAALAYEGDPGPRVT